MDCEPVMEVLKSNPKVVGSATGKLLIRIVQNVLSFPNQPKVRILKKNNQLVQKQIVAVPGGVDCLKLMGFKEEEMQFMLPANVSTKHLENVKESLLKLLSNWTDANGTLPKVPKVEVPTSSPAEDDDIDVKRFILPPFTPSFSNPFLGKIDLYFHNALAFDDKNAQARGKALIPLPQLEIGAQKNLRAHQEAVKKSGQDSEVSLQDMLLLQLLAWFKDVFFTWVDTPDCTHCGGTTTMSHMSKDPAELIYTDRVEIHKCNTCQKFTKFPRYNDLNILLETQRGRCGEWAQVFTLLCRALGWDARYVVDELDHVWTEVYSATQKRWLHCDPCENACDIPLMYESGWNKKLTYVIAYSPEEVQDVTWRYSSRHKEVLAGRHNCSEIELINALIQLRQKRQATFSESRKKYLTKRLVEELAELMTERKPNENDHQGRVSGSADWRVARGEIRRESKWVWIIEDEDISDDAITIRYSAAHDIYEHLLASEAIMMITTWNEGAYSSSNMFRKEETDWKMVYLARKEGTETASVTWKFRVESIDKVIDTVSVKFIQATYETGTIDVTVKSNISNDVTLLPKDQEVVEFSQFSGAEELTIQASLSGGKGSTSWQHTQLFRQPLDSEEFPFIVTFKFKSLEEVKKYPVRSM